MKVRGMSQAAVLASSRCQAPLLPSQSPQLSPGAGADPCLCIRAAPSSHTSSGTSRRSRILTLLLWTASNVAHVGRRRVCHPSSCNDPFFYTFTDHPHLPHRNQEGFQGSGPSEGERLLQEGRDGGTSVASTGRESCTPAGTTSSPSPSATVHSSLISRPPLSGEHFPSRWLLLLWVQRLLGDMLGE